MKADKEASKVIKNDSTTVVGLKKFDKSFIFIILLPILSVFAIVLTGISNNMDILDIMKISIMTFLLTTAMVFFVRLQEHIFDVKFAKSIIIYSYLISIVLIMLPINPEVYSLWMIGGILIAMLVDGKLGLLVYFNLTFILSIAHSINIESTIQLLVMGVLFILLSAYLKTKTTVIYAAIILLSTNITLAFIMNNFIFETNSNVNYLSSFFSILAVVLTAFLLSTLYDRIALKHSINLLDDVSIEDKESFNPANPETITNNDEIKEDISVSDSSTRTSYEVLLSDNNELLQRMKKHSEGLYKHCILIGDLSGRAACIIGANEALARTGGYYHELGKIIGKNYIDEGIKLANEYAFPKELKEILKQHNIKHDKPTFVESAIVMISDNVLSTIEYIDKTGDQKFTSDKIIDNIFRMRMDKGTFDDSGLSIRDFKLLKDFYQKEFRGQGVETGRTKEDTH